MRWFLSYRRSKLKKNFLVFDILKKWTIFGREKARKSNFLELAGHTFITEVKNLAKRNILSYHTTLYLDIYGQDDRKNYISAGKKDIF